MPMPRLIRHGRFRTALILAPLVLAATALAAHRWPGPGLQEAALAWRQEAWRMPLDNWGEGHAWRATLPDGGEITLHARTKTGFCNCFNGVADDTEIDLIGDVDLHGSAFAPVAPGAVTMVGDLHGRKRSFEAHGKWSGTQRVLSIVAAADCKAVVATLVAHGPISAAAEASAVALLTGEAFRRWARDQ